MTQSLEQLHREIQDVRADLALIKNILVEEGELTSWAKKQLKQARQTDEKRYKRLEDV